jgi:phosphoenolpyruvate carboxylase
MPAIPAIWRKSLSEQVPDLALADVASAFDWGAAVAIPERGICRSFANLLPRIGAQNAIPRWIIRDVGDRDSRGLAFAHGESWVWGRRKSLMPCTGNFTRVDMSQLEATLTADALKQEFESVRKEFEAMGAELVNAAKKCEALIADVENTIRETAEAYRQEGKKIFNRIEEHAVLAEYVRKSCEDVKCKIMVGNGGAQ